MPSATSASHSPVMHGLSMPSHPPKMPTVSETVHLPTSNDHSSEGKSASQQELSHGANFSPADSVGLMKQAALNEDNSSNVLAPDKHDAICLDHLSDDKVLEILLKNETVARQFKRACASRLHQYQNDLHQAYNQRLLELEHYTHQWRDTTKDLWVALQEGRIAASTQQQQDALAWQGPQKMGTSSSFLAPSAASGMAQGELDKTGRIPTVSARPPSTAPPRPSAVPEIALLPIRASPAVSPLLTTQLSCPEWIYDLSGYLKNPVTGDFTSGSIKFLTTICSKALGQKFRSVLNVRNSNVTVRVHTDQTGPVYRRMDKINKIRNSVFPKDVVVDLTSANIALLGKAFCYMKDRRELLQGKLNLPMGAQSRQVGQISRLYDLFSLQPTSENLSIRSLPPKCSKARVLYHLEENPHQDPRRLLIARPKHQDGQIIGSEFFDVGRGRRAVPQEARQYCVLLSALQN